MTEDTIKVQNIVSKADYNSLRGYYMYKRKPEQTKILVIIMLISFACLVISKSAFSFPYLKDIGAFGIIVIAFFYSLISWDARRLEKSVKNIMNKKQEISLAEAGFSVKWTGFDLVEYEWSDIGYAVETDAHFYLFLEKYFAIIIPKLELKGHQVKQIHKLLEEHIELTSDTSGWQPKYF